MQPSVVHIQAFCMSSSPVNMIFIHPPTPFYLFIYIYFGGGWGLVWS